MNPLQQFFHGTHMDELDALVLGRHEDPHHALGAHPVEKGVVLRVWRPEAQRVSVEVEDGGAHVLMTRIHPAGVWAAWLPTARLPYHPWIESRYADGATSLARDPYSFLPTWGELDLHLFGEGRIARVDKHLGAHPRTVDGVSGVAFAVWAPNARQVRVVGDWNQWNGRLHPMRRIGASGVWELFVPGALPGALYQFEVAGRDGRTVRKVDPCARRAELRPGQAGIVDDPTPYAWRDAEWIARRADTKPRPLSVYEMHPGSWRRVPEEGDRWLTWRELAPGLIAHVRALGFTHVELMAVAEHPFDGSWGYQVTGYFAPTARFGSPEDFRWFVDELHAHDIGVIVDWVPAHFPKDEFALARFDGTGLYEHADPRQGEHPDWDTLVFNYARFEVRNFLLSNARMWIEDFHVDGLRVDAVASMLYLDYSRAAGEWIPNQHGGRENLAAIAFLRELNGAMRKEFPGVMVLAEESTSWPGVTHAVSAGGLGFTHKWNMGWMHDTLAYFAREPVHRRYHHNELTFGILYAWSERFVLALSHDEVVHLKKSLLGKMPGDRWQQFANLRCLYAWMWCHPGKKLLFMGGEFAQVGEWSHQRSLDWHLVRDPMHHGVMDLVGDLNMLMRREGAMYEADDVTEGFQWVDTHDAEQSVLSFLRFDASRSRFVLCVLHATPEVRGDYRVGVPSPGRYAEVINTDAGRYGGSNVGNLGGVTADEVPRHGFPYSLSLTLPPLSVLVFTAP